MKIPNNVVWFEILLYLSLTLDALSVAFQDRTSSGDLIGPMILEAGLILLLIYFVYLAARKRKNWPRWVLVGAACAFDAFPTAGLGRKWHRAR